MKVRGHIDKVEKEQKRIKQKKLSALSGNSNFKRMVFELFNEHLFHFQFKAHFLLHCSPQCSEFENVSFRATLIKTYNNQEKMKNAYQTCHN